MDADHFEHGTHGAARDDTRTGRRRAQDDLARTMPPDAVVMQRARVTKRYAHQAALGGFRRLADGFRHFTRLAVAEADPAFEVTNDNERGKAEALTALDDLGDAIDVNELVDELARFAVAITSAFSSGFTCHSDLLSSSGVSPS